MTLPARFTVKVLGAILRFLRPKTKLFSLEFRRILEVLCLQILQKRFWAHIHDFCVQTWSCLPWSSDAMWKFSFARCIKSSGHFCKIYASKNEAVCRDVQTHFGSSPQSSVTKRFVGAISQFMRPKTKLFAVKFRRILEVFSMQALW